MTKVAAMATFYASQVDLYLVLGVSRNPSVADIEAAYGRRAMGHHLDELGITSPEDVGKQCFLIEHAYWVLLKEAQDEEEAAKPSQSENVGPITDVQDVPAAAAQPARPPPPPPPPAEPAPARYSEPGSKHSTTNSVEYRAGKRKPRKRKLWATPVEPSVDPLVQSPNKRRRTEVLDRENPGGRQLGGIRY